MLLKHVYLYLKLDEYPAELATPFGFRTRYLCNFIEKRLRPLRFHAEGFSKICVVGTSAPEESCPLVSENAAVPSVAFDRARYERLGPNQHHEFFIELLCAGLAKCSRHHRIPLAETMTAIEDFRRGGYKNEWTHQTKQLRPVGLRALLLCSLDAERFSLRLRLDRAGRPIFEAPVLETLPDELIFAYQFKEVVVDADTVVVKSKFDEPIFSVPLSSLS
jgi:hypothetical protein